MKLLGKNLAVHNQVYGQHPELLPDYVAELIDAKVDVIYASGPVRIRAVQEATKTIPILGAAEDMLGSGLVASLAHPNGNTTGLSLLARELDGKRQELLIEAVPGLRHMAMLADAYTTVDDRKLEEAARARNFALSIYRVAKADEIVAAIGTAHGSGATGLVIQSSPTFFINRQFIMDRVAALRLPTMYPAPEVADEGVGSSRRNTDCPMANSPMIFRARPND
jgi:putative ABC transport system substrate-binding protein